MKLDELDDITRAATEHYVSRFGEIERLLNVWAECENAGHYEWAGDISDRLDEMPLSVELEAIYPRREQCEWSILLGTGGPADRVLVTTDLAGNVEEATYSIKTGSPPGRMPMGRTGTWWSHSRTGSTSGT